MQFLIKFIKIKNIKIFYFYVSICLVMISSITYFGWSETWTMVRVPSMNPIFADMRTVQGGLLSHDDGLNPQVVNPHDPWKRAMNYPSIWLNIGRLLGLDKELNYILFCLIEIIAFLCVCGYLLYKSPSPLLLLSIISTASLLAIERGNNDLIIFSLIFLFSSISFLKISCVLIILSFVLKIYPLFSIGAMVVKRDQWLLALTLIPVALISFINYDDYFLTLSGVPAGGLAWNYGLPAIKSLLARMFPFTNLPFIILLIIIIVLVIIFIFILKKYNLQTKSSNLHYTLFLVGSCLYTGTYAFSSSFDYRLIFLILCIPFLLDIRCSIGIPIILLILLAMNVGWLHFGKSGIFNILGIAVNIASKLLIFIAFSSFLILGFVAPNVLKTKKSF